MTTNYAALAAENLEKALASPPPDMAERLGAAVEHGVYRFRAFGRACELSASGVVLDQEAETGVLGLLVSLYARHASPEPLVPEPAVAYRDVPGTMPYHAAFASHTERVLVPKTGKIRAARDRILDNLGGGDMPGAMGDFSFAVRPLPKIALYYIFYEADDEFPASVTCLFSNNCARFMPVDGLADVGEYTSRRILELCG